jgi:hypothetical protein
MRLGVYLLFAFTGIIIASCSSDADAEIKSKVSAFIANNDKVVAFGNAELKNMIEKTGYSENDKLNSLIGTELATVGGVLDISSAVYFAAEGPFDDEGSPETIHLFMKVKNVDSLRIELESRSYDINKAGKVEYVDEGDFVLGFDNNLAIATVTGKDFDAKKLVSKNFKLTNGDSAGETVDEILDTEGDLVFGMHLANLYETSDTDLEKLDKKTRKELTDMMKDSYVKTTFKFEDGAAIIETKNYFSDALMDQMFMNADPNAPILKKLGKGTPRLGVSVNMDVKKMQAFMDKFSPDATDELMGSLGGFGPVVSMAAGSQGLAGILKGQFGALVFTEEDEFGMEPHFNIFVGLTSKGKSIGEMGKDNLSFFIKNIDVDNEGISAYTDEKFAPSASGKLNLPKGCEDFGKGGISFFVNLDGIDVEEFAMDFDDEARFLEVVKYISFNYDNSGGRLVIKAKDGKENILKQGFGVVKDELVEEISKVTI